MAAMFAAKSIALDAATQPPTIQLCSPQRLAAVASEANDQHTLVDNPTKNRTMDSPWALQETVSSQTVEDNTTASSTLECAAAGCSDRTRLDGRWEERFEELREYRKSHGHCIVPQRDGKLGKWVQYQREAYKEKEEGTYAGSSLTDERERRLERMGFVWKVREHAPPDAWEERYSELCEYKALHGHCAVPQRDGRLGNWVKNQRKGYSAKRGGKKSNLTDEREMKLERIGFAWKVRDAPPSDSWERRYDELCDYKHMHGDCLVPQRDGQLGSWVNTQRWLYSQKVNGKQNALTDERVAKLNSIGFVWKVRDICIAQQSTKESSTDAVQSHEE